ncbi:MAG TPA: type I-C CRISPR-associated protein Cas7/Csd2 [Clostridiaceae bacterium]|nr:type I-C CRISPR-associated protein Cas7/Csd2 [Clostridiaceae bacterium]
MEKKIISNRYEFVYLFDVENGNPNGDPDAGNLPRFDPETSVGLVTDVCIKRKIRNYVELVKKDKEGNQEIGYDIYVREGAVLNNENKKAYDNLGISVDGKKTREQQQKLTKFMCSHFFDIRAFGAVMTTEINCGQVRGPVQMNFAKSIDPIVPQEVTITRMAVTNEKDAEKERTMGRKSFVPYGLYRMEGYISAHLAQKTGFNTDDLELLWNALINLFEHDRSASHGKMSARKLIVFEHKFALGNAPAQKLFDLIEVKRKDMEKSPRAFNDYEIIIDRENVPEGITLLELL